MSGAKSIYVAGSSKERELVAAYQAGLRAVGWRISHDWVAEMNAAAVPDHELSVDQQALFAEADLLGIDKAQVFWLLSPSAPSIGAYVELGYALGCNGVRVVVSGRPSLFTSLAHERYATHAEAFLALTRPGELPVATEALR